MVNAPPGVGCHGWLAIMDASLEQVITPAGAQGQEEDTGSCQADCFCVARAPSRAGRMDCCLPQACTPQPPALCSPDNTANPAAGDPASSRKALEHGGLRMTGKARKDFWKKHSGLGSR